MGPWQLLGAVILLSPLLIATTGFLLAIILDLKKIDRSKEPLNTPDETLLESLVPENQDVLTYIDELKNSSEKH